MPRNRYANVCGWEFTTIKCVVMGHFAESCLTSTVKARWLVNLENMKNALRLGDVRGDGSTYARGCGGGVPFVVVIFRTATDRGCIRSR